MSVRAIHHVLLAMPVGGEPEAVEFYADLLGLPVAPKPPHLEKRGGCWFEAGGIRVHLGVDHDFRPARKAHPAFVVDRLSEVEDRLQRSGIEIQVDEELAGFRRFYVNDPFGNRIELMEELG